MIGLVKIIPGHIACSILILNLICRKIQE